MLEDVDVLRAVIMAADTLDNAPPELLDEVAVARVRVEQIEIELGVPACEAARQQATANESLRVAMMTGDVTQIELALESQSELASSEVVVDARKERKQLRHQAKKVTLTKKEIHGWNGALDSHLSSCRKRRGSRRNRRWTPRKQKCQGQPWTTLD